MRPREKKLTHEQPIIATARLELLIDLEHELVRLADRIDWAELAEGFGPLYSPDKGRPGIPIRTMAGLVMLQHTFALSDEEVLARWVENPYYQYFCGEEFFQHRLPVDDSQLSRWRKRIGESGAERILNATIVAGIQTKTVLPEDLEVVVVDTTVQEKACAHPTDTRLYVQVHRKLLSIAKKEGIELRQSYRQVVRQAHQKHGGYMKAKQFKRARKAQKKIKTIASRVMRDLERKMDEATFQKHKGDLILSELILTQGKGGPGKVYSLPFPEAECIAKGKAHKRYEFGVKVSVAITARTGFLVGAMSFAGNPYDGHTLERQLDQVQQMTERPLARVHVDMGYKGHGVPEDRCQVVVARSKRGITPEVRQEMKRRNSVEPAIGHMKSDGKLGRNFLKGQVGDAINAVFCGVGHNLRKILRRLRLSLYASTASQCSGGWLTVGLWWRSGPFAYVAA